jgi:hypothetical protein
MDALGRNPVPQSKSSAAVATSASTTTKKLPFLCLKEPAWSLRPEEIRAEIADMVRKQLLPDKRPEKKATQRKRAWL